MQSFDPAHFSSLTGGRWQGNPPPSVNGFAFDTRSIEANQCFIALQGERRDGHDFVDEARGRGASCALTNRVLDCKIPQLVVADPLLAMGAIAADRRRRFDQPVVGITGSCGKTSTKEMLRLLLGADVTHATSGNRNNRIGVPMTLFDLDLGRDRFAVIEVGINQPGEMALLGEMIRADLSILTNIGPAHLELLGSLEGIADEKSKLALRARPGSPIILPLDALQYSAYAGMADRCVAVRFNGQAVPVADAIEVVDCQIDEAQGGLVHQVRINENTFRINSSSFGIAQNAALALVAARRLGIPTEELAERLLGWAPENTRGRVISTKESYYYIDCYNANPASMRDALAAFRRASPARLARCYVLGVMDELGEAAPGMHRAIGWNLKLRPEDRVLCVGSEDLTSDYLEGATGGGARPDQMDCLRNTGAAQSTVADFRGALFLKGSRSCHLETLLPESLR